MLRFKLIEKGFEVGQLVEAIEQHPELWEQITIRQMYPGSAHADTETMFVRGPASFTVEDYFQSLGSFDNPMVMDALREPLMDLLLPVFDEYPYVELGRILIVKLKPGGKLTPHIDEGVYSDYFTRYHLALTTNNESYLRVENEFVHMEPGELWCFNHKKMHSAENGGTTDRIHMIIDMVPS